MTDDDYIKKILDKYKEKKPVYNEFCFTIYQLIDSLLKNGQYKYQILYRIKELNRLEEKLIRKMRAGKIYENLEDVEDLAGLRIIFYLKRDENKFLKNIKKEISGKIKIQNTQKKNGYEATHLIISLGEKRLQLTEYQKYQDLKCELQITSILQNAWSEIEHDIIYKDINQIKKIDPTMYKSIRQRLNKILKYHIKKATSEFETIFNQIKKINKK